MLEGDFLEIRVLKKLEFGYLMGSLGLCQSSLKDSSEFKDLKEDSNTYLIVGGEKMVKNPKN